MNQLARAYDRIRDDKWVTTLIAMVAQETNGAVILIDQGIDSAMIGLEYVNPTQGIRCNVGLFDPGIVIQIYSTEDEDLGEVTDDDRTTPPQDAPDRAYVKTLVALLGEADAIGREQVSGSQ